MANTYVKILIHMVFAVKNRESLISSLWQERLYAYIASLLRDKDCIPLAIGGIENHIHVFFSASPKVSISDLARDLKSQSTRFVNDNRLSVFHFEWQKGYACFSHSTSQADDVVNYIKTQAEHHKSHTLRAEIGRIFEKCGIDYNEDYLFKEPI